MTSIADVYPVDDTRMPRPRAHQVTRAGAYGPPQQVASKPPQKVTQKVVKPYKVTQKVVQPYISGALHEYICMCLIVFIILKMHIDVVQQLVI